MAERKPEILYCTGAARQAQGMQKGRREGCQRRRNIYQKSWTGRLKGERQCKNLIKFQSNPFDSNHRYIWRTKPFFSSVSDISPSQLCPCIGAFLTLPMLLLRMSERRMSEFTLLRLQHRCGEGNCAEVLVHSLTDNSEPKRRELNMSGMS